MTRRWLTAAILGDCTMIAKVSADGLLIPKEMLGNSEEVEVRKEPGRIVVLLDPKDDPIFNLGKNPVTSDVTDASINHDKYIYGQ
jgi:hypothetical protein